MPQDEYGSLEREIEIDAPPEVVFTVVSSPEHLKQWWPDDCDLDPTPGAEGHLVFGDPGSPGAHLPQVTVVDAVPGRLFSFRWVYPEDEAAGPGNSLLVTFEIEPTAAGSRLRLTETGWRERGWEAAVLEREYHDHETGWDFYLPRLRGYAPSVATVR